MVVFNNKPNYSKKLFIWQTVNTYPSEEICDKNILLGWMTDMQ